MDTFGTRLKRAREAKGVSQAVIAAACDIKSRNAVSLWEHDQNMPSVENLICLCRLLEASADELLGLKSAESPISGMPPKIIKTARKLSQLTPEAKDHVMGLIECLPSNQASEIWDKIFSYDPTQDPRHENMMKIIESAQASKKPKID